MKFISAVHISEYSFSQKALASIRLFDRLLENGSILVVDIDVYYESVDGKEDVEVPNFSFDAYRNSDGDISISIKYTAEYPIEKIRYDIQFMFSFTDAYVNDGLKHDVLAMKDDELRSMLVYKCISTCIKNLAERNIFTFKGGYFSRKKIPFKIVGGNIIFLQKT